MTWSHHRRRATVAHTDERGAVLILVAICAAVLVLAVSFTVDIGRISTTRRDLQKVADVAALDVSRRLDGRTRAEVEPSAQLALVHALTRNGLDPDTATMDLGWWDPNLELWRSAGPNEVPDAAKVLVNGHIDYLFQPGGRDTSRLGIASRGAAADVCVGSFSARISTDDSPILNGLLQGILGSSIDLVGYRGLVDGSVSVEALATELGTSLGDPTSFLGTQVSLQDFVLAEAKVLADAGDLSRAQILEQTALGLPNPAQIISIGDVIAIGRGSTSALLGSDLDAFDLLTTAALVANGTNAISVPNLSLGVPGVATVTAVVEVIEQPRCLVAAMVGDSLQTAAIRVSIDSNLGVLSLVNTDLHASVDVAAGQGHITNITCEDPRHLGLDLTTGLTTTNVAFDLLVDLLGTEISVPVTGGVSNAQAAYRYDQVFPPAVLGQPVQVPTPGLGLGSASLTIGGDLSVVGAIVTPLVTLTLNPVVAALDAVVFTPVLDGLGTTVAGIDVTARDIRCEAPSLVG